MVDLFSSCDCTSCHFIIDTSFIWKGDLRHCRGLILTLNLFLICLTLFFCFLQQSEPLVSHFWVRSSHQKAIKHSSSIKLYDATNARYKINPKSLEVTVKRFIQPYPSWIFTFFPSMISQGTHVHAMSNLFTKTLRTTQESHDLRSSLSKAFQVNTFLHQNELSKFSTSFNAFQILQHYLILAALRKFFPLSVSYQTKNLILMPATTISLYHTSHYVHINQLSNTKMIINASKG